MSDLLVVVGARPNYMKAASVVEAARAAGIGCTLVHTGQHYDDALSRVFFDELELPAADVNLGVGSGTHATQTAGVMLAFEKELFKIDPAVVVVVGDVNSTLACALVAAKEHYPVAHVEAGLRSFDERMPEEINRRLCDHISRFLFTTARDGDQNLLTEGVDPARIHFVGNTMIDTLLRFAGAARARRVPERLGVGSRPYVEVTLHRPETVDDRDALAEVVSAITAIAARVPVVFPVHPRTRDRLAGSNLLDKLRGEPDVILLPPLGYLDFVGLTADAAAVLTDSGGVQEETTVLGRPCLTVRDRTERPVTITAGTNQIVGTGAADIIAGTMRVLENPAPAPSPPELWDGRAGERIVAELARALGRDAVGQVGA